MFTEYKLPYTIAERPIYLDTASVLFLSGFLLFLIVGTYIFKPHERYIGRQVLEIAIATQQKQIEMMDTQAKDYDKTLETNKLVHELKDYLTRNNL